MKNMIMMINNAGYVFKAKAHATDICIIFHINDILNDS